MSKYVPAEFSPHIFRAWGDIFKTLSDHDCAELLKAITLFPDYEPEGVPLWAFFKGELERQHGKFSGRCSQMRDARKKSQVNHSETDTDSSRLKSTQVDQSRLENSSVDSAASIEIETGIETGIEIDRKKKKENSQSTSSTASISQKASPILKPEGVPKDDWDAWKRLRKQKNLPLTQRALEQALAEAGKAGISPADMIRICLENSWAGFKASWMQNIRNASQPVDSKTRAQQLVANLLADEAKRNHVEGVA